MSDAVIVGIDEAGRGALAGPVIAAACVFDNRSAGSVTCADNRIRAPEDIRITDSKLLTEEERETAFAFLIEHHPYGVGMVDAKTIDEIGIMAATEKAMQQAVAELAKIVKPTYLLVDGRDKFWFDYPHSSVIKGDQKERCIAAASILAKVTRDRLMVEYDEEFPEYGLREHKGYGTESHTAAIQRIGPSNLHRRTFLRNIHSVSAPSGAF